MKLVTVTEASKIIKKSRQYVWTLIQMKRINGFQIGNQWVIPEAELKKYLLR